VRERVGGLDRSAGDDESGALATRRGTSRRAPRARRVAAALLICLGVAGSIGFVAGYFVQQSWKTTTATIHDEQCHQADGGDGGPFTACAVDVSFIDLRGQTRFAYLKGVPRKRIHNNSLVIYLDPKSPTEAINPQSWIPLWAFIFFAAMMWALLGGVAWLLLGPSVVRRSRNAAGEVVHRRLRSRRGDN